MNQRWMQKLAESIPEHDLQDLKLGREDTSKQRQIAPEYADVIYQNMLTNEALIGDYLSLKDSKKNVTAKTRGHMVTLIEALVKEKGYKEETLFLAVSLVDRYLFKLKNTGLRPPCLIELAVTCTLMAAKIE